MDLQGDRPSYLNLLALHPMLSRSGLNPGIPASLPSQEGPSRSAARSWRSTGGSSARPRTPLFFGLPADVQAAVYLHDLFALAFVAETAAFQATEIYRSTHGSRRRSATNSFQVGLAQGIIRKLDALRHTRDVAGGSTNGRALVPIKDSIIDEEMERLGLSLRRRSAVRRMVGRVQRRSGSR